MDNACHIACASSSQPNGGKSISSVAAASGSSSTCKACIFSVSCKKVTVEHDERQSPVRKPPLATKNLLEHTDGLR